MKFIKQKNMGESYIEQGKAAWHPPVWCEEPLVDSWIAACAHSGIELEVVDTEGAFFDPGGMVMHDEPECAITVNGQQMWTFLRSAESLVPRLRKECQWREGFEGPPHVFVRSPLRGHVLLTPETAALAADAFEKEAEERAAEADKWWAERDVALKDAGAIDAMALRNPVEAVKQEARRAANNQ